MNISATCIDIVDCIQELREDEGSSVTINCQNPDDGPKERVGCCGAWTDWEERIFDGDYLRETLIKARDAYRQRKAGA